MPMNVINKKYCTSVSSSTFSISIYVELLFFFLKIKCTRNKLQKENDISSSIISWELKTTLISLTKKIQAPKKIINLKMNVSTLKMQDAANNS